MDLAAVTDRTGAVEMPAQMWRVFILCGLLLALDGFDVQAIAYVGPALLSEWHISGATLGMALAAANLGLLCGALALSNLADRYGRRPVLIGSALFFAAVTLLTARAQSVQQLMALRFLAGIGMGSIMPIATALITEYSPSTRRASLGMFIAVPFTAGGAIGSFLAAGLIAEFGWRAVFVVGGVLPLLFGALMLALLPESPAMECERPGQSTDVLEKRSRRSDVRDLFRDGRSRFSVAFWLVNLTNLVTLYFLAGFLPVVFHSSGMPAALAVMTGGGVQVGGVVGVFILAWFVRRWGLPGTLLASFSLAAIAIPFIGLDWSLQHHGILFCIVFIAGVGTVAGQPALNTLGALFYPSHIRSTGVGWGLGIGRLGAIFGPMLGGYLFDLHSERLQIFLVFALTAAFSAVGMTYLHRLQQRGELDDWSAVSHSGRKLFGK